MLQPMKAIIAILFALACAFTARAAIHTETVEYKNGDTLLEGRLVGGIRAQASEQPEPEGRTAEYSGQCAKTKCQLVHTLPRR